MLDKGWDLDPRWRDRGLEAARRAVTLDPQRPEGYKAEALLHQVDRATEPAIAALERALACDPSFTPALINLAQEYLHLGDFAAAERMLRRAGAVDPAYGLTQLLLSLVFLYTRRWSEAIAACHRAQSVGASPFHSSYAYAMRAQAYLGASDIVAARQEIAGGRAAALSPRLLKAAEALVEAHARSFERARELLIELEAEPPEEAYGSELAAAAAGLLGEAARVTRFLEAAEAVDKRHPPAWRIQPDLRAVRAAPEFRRWIGDRGRSVVWPYEAPALDPEDRAELGSFAEASGLAEPFGEIGERKA
jgi:tetratricopeptide (TPR) repeat protein